LKNTQLKQENNIIIPKQSDIDKLVTKVESLIQTNTVEFFNGDKREIFERLIALELNQKSLSSTMDRNTQELKCILDKFISSLPCDCHTKSISNTKLSIEKCNTNIEKRKFLLFTTMVSVLTTIAAIVVAIVK
jgi:hypothetical protein